MAEDISKFGAPSTECPLEFPTGILVKALQVCRDVYGDRENSELRSSLATIFGMYGREIFPEYLRFIRKLLCTLSTIDGVKNKFKENIGALAVECEKHVKTAERLELLHKFTVDTFSRMVKTIPERTTILRAQAASRRPYCSLVFRILGLRTVRREALMAAERERHDVEAAIDSIDELRKCCEQVKDQMTNINNGLGCIREWFNHICNRMQCAEKEGDAGYNMYSETIKGFAMDLMTRLRRLYTDAREFRKALWDFQRDVNIWKQQVALEWRKDLSDFISRKYSIGGG